MGFKLANGEKMKTIRVASETADSYGGLSDYAKKNIVKVNKGFYNPKGTSVIKVPKSEFKTAKSDLFKSSEGPSTAKDFRKLKTKQTLKKVALGAANVGLFQLIKAK